MEVHKHLRKLCHFYSIDLSLSWKVNMILNMPNNNTNSNTRYIAFIKIPHLSTMICPKQAEVGHLNTIESKIRKTVEL